VNSEWQRRNLGDVCSFVRGPFGGSLKKEIFVPKGFAVYEQQHAIYNQFDQIRYFIDEDKFSEMQRFELQANDLIMSCSGTMGKVAVVPVGIRKGIINQALLKLTPSKEVHCFFLKYWMESQDFQEMLKEQAGGAAIQNVASVIILKEIKIPLPSFEEQHRIVTLLDEAFADIATAKANAEKNLQNARELFDNALQSLVDGTSNDWTQRTMAEVCDITSKLVDPREDQYLDLPHVGAGNIESKTSALVDVKTAREENLISGKFLFDESMVLYSKIRPYLMKVLRPDFNGLCSADIYPLAPKPGVITRDYLYYLLLAPAFTEYAIKGSARAGMPKVNREHLFAYQFVLPKVQDQKRIAENLDQIANETIRLESIYRQKLTALDGLKKSLLYQAFSGQL
jgi:type I restriction enzyme, S subunit